MLVSELKNLIAVFSQLKYPQNNEQQNGFTTAKRPNSLANTVDFLVHTLNEQWKKREA